jgi:CheY-like chemotaxis protein
VGDAPVLIHFTVRDTGIGIPPEQHDRLFRSFSQGDASTTRRYGGTGLGLAISRRLVQLMGGTMWVESEVGEGSAFHFTITATPGAVARRRLRAVGEQPKLRGRRVLVVDDNATNRRMLAVQTGSWGMEARCCESPAEALEWIQRGEAFDLAMLDMHMPGMDGVSLAAEIRKHRGAEALPLVLLSSLAGPEVATSAELFAVCLPKPIKQSALLDAVMTALGATPSTPPPAPPSVVLIKPHMASRHPLRILLAEDNVVNQKVALRLLSQMGYRADVAANGLEAIDALVRQPYDLVLMDVQMPEMDGLEATRRICARWPRERRPRIIAMTADAMQGDREKCLRAGMDDYVSKPIRVSELVSALSRSSPRDDA